MKYLVFVVIVLSTLFVFAADKKQKKVNQTEVSFDDLLVQGKYHFSDEAITTVEDDKVLDALLGVRKDFKDRIQRSASRH